MAKRANKHKSDNTVTFYQLAHTLLHDGKTLAENAEALGLEPREIADGVANHNFYAVYEAEKASMVREIFTRLCNKATGAIDVMGEIVNNPDCNPATRLQSCQSILNYIRDFREALKDVENDTIESARRAKLFGD